MLKHLKNNKCFLILLFVLYCGIQIGHAQEGYINGFFTVDASGTQVVFSQGNLQYKASTNTWRFATNQWDYVEGTVGNSGIFYGNVSGSSNNNIASSYNGWIDLFGWGTSGYDHGANCYQPWSTSETNSDYYAYGQVTYNLFDQTGKADWGYNAISNGGNLTGQWRTLTIEEWQYVFKTRSTPSGIRYAKAVVNGVGGVILLPDHWSSSYYSLSSTNNSGASFHSNVIPLNQWTILEQHGAVFLPTAGYRDGTSVAYFGSVGYYWSASGGNSDWAGSVYFHDAFLVADYGSYRCKGQSVRLVRSTQSYSINAFSSPNVGGVVNGGGVCEVGAECTLTATANEGYAFVNWMENGTPVSTNTTYTFTVANDRMLVANFMFMGNNTHLGGALEGLFKVSDSTWVNFSQGNLQYIGSASTPYWKFADCQWEYLGNNGQGSTSQHVDRDLFGWGTSGFNHGANCYQPWSTSTTDSDYHAYGQYANNLFDQTGQADWGFNAISNGGDQVGIWRTLTYEEWQYVFNTRSTSSGIRYAKATVNNVNGVILVPDDWSSSYFSLSNTNQNGASYSSNTITSVQWVNNLEQHGAVFLPAAGYRNWTSVNYVGLNGRYWTASFFNSYGARHVYFNDSGLSADSYNGRIYGQSVRLVRALHAQIYSINATPSPAEGGTVSGGGNYAEGTTCSLTATANEGYAFVNWTENGIVVSSDASFSFTVSGERNMVANFAVVSVFGLLNGVFSVGQNAYVHFSKGNLQYIGSASTPYWKFADHQWEYLGKTTSQNSSSQNVDRDLFGWGTSGYDHGAACFQPWSISIYNSDYYVYGSDTCNLFDQTGQADWGNNAILNGGNEANSGWRTLTQEEWMYLMDERSTASGIRYAKAVVNNVNGVILLPDDWSVSNYSLVNTNQSDASFNSNVISDLQWDSFQQYGAVFLPAAGWRSATSVLDVNTQGVYWSSSHYGDDGAWSLVIEDGFIASDGYHYTYRYAGISVRLVRTTSTSSYYGINTISNPPEGGMVSGSGTYSEGTTCTLTATANEGYAFVNWTENGVVVSYEPIYSFVVTGDRMLTAIFVPELYEVTLNAGNGICQVTSVTQSAIDAPITLPTATPSAFCQSEGFYFVGWSESFVEETLALPTLFMAGEAYYPSENTTLYAVYAIDGSGWVDVTDVDQVEEGNYVIASKYNDQYYYLPHEGSVNTPNAIPVTIVEGAPELAAAAHQWTVSQINNDSLRQYAITYEEDGETYYLKARGNINNAIEVTTSDPGAGWTFSNHTSLGLLACFPNPIPNRVTRYLVLYNGSYWRFHPVYLYYGELHLFRAPSTTYATDPECQIEVAAPVFVNLPEGLIYEDSYTVVLTCATPGAQIRYTMDGSTPNVYSDLYMSSIPLVISSNCTISAIAFYNGESSEVVTHSFTFAPHCGIDVAANPLEGGIVSGGGTYLVGATCTLIATANTGYAFLNWLENGEVISYKDSLEFVVIDNRTIIANFQQINLNSPVIEIYPGWNWISNLLAEETPLEVALSDLNPSHGDLIKSQDAYSTYNANTGRWEGNLTYLVPGRGLIYLNTSNETKSFHYPQE